MQLSAQAPVLVKDINQSKANSNPRGMATAGNTVFFSVDDAVHGRELWKTDGTAANTVLVKDINPEGDANPSDFCNVNGIVFFTAYTHGTGRELWKTDGTANGTVLVSDVLPGVSNSQISKMTSCNGKLFFSAVKRIVTQVGVIDVLKLFVSDGTAEGTFLLDINDAIRIPENLTAVGNTLFFTATSVNAGIELYKTTGTTASTQLVKDIRPGGSSSTPRQLINVLGTLHFSANDGVNGRQIWKTNGSAVGTQRISSLQTQGQPGVETAEIAAIGAVIFFSASSNLPNLGNQIFRISEAGVIAQLNNVVSGTQLTAAGGKLFFTQSPQFGNTSLNFVNANSTVVQLSREFPIIPGIDNGGPRNLTATSGQLFFTAGTLNEGRELWKSSGGALNTSLVQDFVPGVSSADISDICVRTNEIFFACNGNDGNELRRSNGANNGIISVRNITHAGSNPSGFIKFGNFTFFAANDGTNGRELWRTDGTPAGTTLFKNINSGASSSNPDQFIITTTNGISTLFFVADNGIHGRELWKSDGTSNGTERVSDIIPGQGNAGIGNMTAVNGVLHFTASSGLATGNRIFKVSANLAGVQTTGAITSHANDLEAIGSTLFFTQSPQIGGPQLCKLVNGNIAVVKTFALIPQGEYPIPQQLTAVGNTLFFTAVDAAAGRELWKSNGTAAGTVAISDIIPGTGNAGIGNMVSFNGVLHFTASSGTSLGDRIYKTNAALTGVMTTGGVQVFADHLTPTVARLYFTQQGHLQGEGPSLCALEGGITTTLKNFDLLTDFQSATPEQLTAVGNKVFFTAASAATGRELWKSDGVSTISLGDLRPGIGNSNVLNMTVCGQDLFLGLNTLATGMEPHRIAGAVGFAAESEDRQAAQEEQENTEEQVLEVRVFPNPASDMVQMAISENNTGGTWLLMNTAGAVLRQETVAAETTVVHIPVGDLPRGVCLLRWTDRAGHVQSTKVLLQ
jgi:ELWxxDGT repeat protein